MYIYDMIERIFFTSVEKRRENVQDKIGTLKKKTKPAINKFEKVLYNFYSIGNLKEYENI